MGYQKVLAHMQKTCRQSCYNFSYRCVIYVAEQCVAEKSGVWVRSIIVTSSVKSHLLGKMKRGSKILELGGLHFVVFMCNYM